MLGPPKALVHGADVDLHRTLERALLARLALDRAQVVGLDRLVDDIWGEALPRDPKGSIQSLVYRLRQTLGAAGGAVVLETGGYRLALDDEAVDASRFDALVREARELRDEDDHPSAADRLKAALDLWYGAPLGSLESVPFVKAHALRLRSAKLGALGQRIDADLRLGRHEDLLAELEGLVEEYPLEERLWGQLMLAHYRCGAQAEALRRYQALRHVLADQLGIDPSPDVQNLERRILAQDPALIENVSEPPHTTTTAGTTDRPDVGPPRTVLMLRLGPASTDPGGVSADDHHRREVFHGIVHQCLSEHRGRQGGGTSHLRCVVFDQPDDALRAAADLHRQLRDATRGSVQTSAAVHTGTVDERRANASGPAVMLARRIVDASHVGQTLISSATAELLADTASTELELRNVGSWVLVGHPKPVGLYEVTGGGGESFGGLRTGRPATPILPRPDNTFVGRGDEMQHLAELLTSRHLVTITGPGGAGKTRLAVEIADQLASNFVDGAWLCDLAMATSVDEVLDAIAATLYLNPEVEGIALTRAIAERLRMFDGILILDNCEAARTAVLDVVENQHCSGDGAYLLVTSRRPLGSPREHVVRIGPLAPSATPGGEDPALVLLRDRAEVAGAKLDDPDHVLLPIVEQVGRLPLGIELAARRVHTIGASVLGTRLRQSYSILDTGVSGARHGSLVAPIQSSYDLLTSPEQSLLRAMAVCERGCSSAAVLSLGACQSLDPDQSLLALAALCEHCLVRADSVHGRHVRYTMLEPVHAFAAAKLARDERRFAIEEAHSHHYGQLVEHAVVAGYGPGEQQWLQWLDEEFANIRAVFRRLVVDRDDSRLTQLLGGLLDELTVRGRREVARWANDVLDLPDIGPTLESMALAVTANSALTNGRLGEASAAAVRSRDVARRAGADVPWVVSNCLALAEAAAGRVRSAFALLDELEDAPWCSMAPAVARFDRCLIASFTSNPLVALPQAEVLIEAWEKTQSPTFGSMALISRARCLAKIQPRQAVADCAEAEGLAMSVRSDLLANQAKRLALEVNGEQQDLSAVLRHLRSLLRDFERSGDLSQQLQTVDASLPPLRALGPLRDATIIAAALAKTAVGGSPRCLDVLARARESLPTSEYEATVGLGNELTAEEAVQAASRLFARLV